MIEAGLGGRWDATNVIPSKVAGAHVGRARAHALAGADDRRHRRGEARRRARPRDARRRRPAAGGAARSRSGSRRSGTRRSRGRAGRGGDPPLRPAAFQRRNFAVARGGGRGVPRGAARLRTRSPRAAAETRVPGRLEVVSAERPLVLHDGAHNPAGAEALAAALPEVIGRAAARGRDRGVLDDKDAAAMLRALLPLCSTRSCSPAARTRARCRRRRSRRSPRSSAGRPRPRCVADPRAAVERARRDGRAGRRGDRDGLDLPDRRPRRRESARCGRGCRRL